MAGQEPGPRTDARGPTRRDRTRTLLELGLDRSLCLIDHLAP
ncbi:hypothetical protein SBD_5582 [Streptomyces bottropensis ATCC 25435]|uniref:Uncharacterized protein n=1 Tax=Streptomyces bottropensis ATCC 25435 TaxID=1054862 RepID=M3E8N6_9ACTN|nr:hypothetical protein SBD_5582 [Streptomyces bottropensis ATCC 25435]